MLQGKATAHQEVGSRFEHSEEPPEWITRAVGVAHELTAVTAEAEQQRAALILGAQGRAKHLSLEGNNLKSRAVAAAEKILASQGVEDLNLRAIADLAGIGIASMYHYFGSKDDLLLHLAVRGFDHLHSEMLRLQSDPQFSSPMRAGGRAFVDFACAQPALFSLMFNSRLLARHEVLRAAEARALQAYEAAVRIDDRIPREHQSNAALAIWALGRGIAGVISSQPADQCAVELTQRLFAGAAFLLDHAQFAIATDDRSARQPHTAADIAAVRCSAAKR